MFVIKNRLIADVEPIFYKAPKSGESYALGETVKDSADGITKASGTDKPGYLVAGKVTGAGLLPIIPILPTTVFETKCSLQVAATVVGSKVTLAADGLSATATTTGGVFTVLSTDAATKSVVCGKFE